jgi:ribosome assembly protein 4
MTQPSKRAKTEGASGALPSSIIVNFANQDGERAGPPVDLPIDSNVKQLDLLINNLLGNEEQLPYTFYVNDVEVGGSIKETLESLQSTSKMSFEDTLHISYQPLSLFRVRPVTRCVETMPGHTDAVLHVSYSPDGRKLASGGGDMAVRFWNVITHMPVHTCTGHRHHVLCTAWAPSGAYFVSADRAGEIRVWNPDTGEQRGPALRGHSKWITSLSFEPFHCDPTCTRLASSSKDNSIKVWDTITGTTSV